MCVCVCACVRVCVCVCVCVFEFEFLVIAYAHCRHRGILEAAGHIILTPANQLMAKGIIIWSLSNPGFEPATFRSLAQNIVLDVSINS
jgi:hypothetical protein